MATGVEILLVTSPGLSVGLYAPLVRELREAGARVTPVSFPCSGDAASLSGAVARVGRGRPVVVVAHGVGATLALMAADRLEVARWVLVGPVLDVVPGPWQAEVASMPEVAALDLSRVRWDRADAVLGAGWTEVGTCVAPGLARDVRGWLRTGLVPVDPTAVPEPVWVEVGLLDEVSAVEATVPAARRFPDATVVRPGIARLDPRDYRHLDLVREPAPVRLAARAAVEGW